MHQGIDGLVGHLQAELLSEPLLDFVIAREAFLLLEPSLQSGEYGARQCTLARLRPALMLLGEAYVARRGWRGHLSRTRPPLS